MAMSEEVDFEPLQGSLLHITFTDGTEMSIPTVTPAETLREDVDSILEAFSDTGVGFLPVTEHLGYHHWISMDQISTLLIEPCVLTGNEIARRIPGRSAMPVRTTKRPAKKATRSDG